MRVDTLDLVRAQGVLRTLVLALLARVPLSAIGLLLVLEVRDLDHSYALAGACSGGCALGMAFGSPALGRLIDRTGQAPILVWSGLAVMACTTAFALLPAATPAPLFLVVALAIGAAQPPVGSCVRVLWRRMLDKPRFGALVTLDASLQELAFMSGPLLLIGIASAAGPASALVVTGLLLGGTALVFAALPETRRLGGAPGTSQVTTDANPAAPARSPLAEPSIRILLVIAALMGVAFGATEIGIVTGAEEEDASGVAGVLFALWGVGSFVGGLVWARRGHGLNQTTAALAFLTVLGVTSLALVAATDVWTLGLGLVLAGAAVAPLFGVLYGLMADIAAPESLTEAFTWETSAITAGIALGSTVAGAIANALEPTATFAVAGAAFLLGAALLAGGWGGSLRVATTCRVATAHH